MSFITRWIENNMEEPATREAIINNGILDVNKGRMDNQKRWAEPVRAESSWKNTWFHHAREQDAMCAGSDSKQSKYYANSTSRANSYDSVLDIYTLKENQASKEALY